jgi:hypothetical protein
MPKSGDFECLLATPEPPRLTSDPRPGVMAEASLNAQLAALFEQHKALGEKRELIRALLLLWHDHPEPAHRIVQAFETGDGALIHAILHRREPDYGNAAYWFRRVGEHPVYPTLAAGATNFLKQQPNGSGVLAKLVRGGNWDPFAFIAACEQATENEEPVLRELQRLESAALLNWLCR